MRKSLMIGTAFFGALMITTLLSLTAFAGEDLTRRDQVFEYLKKNVVDKKMDHTQDIINEQAGFASKFSRQARYTELVKTTRGFKMKFIANIQQIKSNLVKGQPDPATAVAVDRVVIVEFSVAQKLSTDELLGRAIVTTNTLTDPGADVSLVKIDLKDDVLKITTEAVPYTDGFGPGDKWVPMNMTESSTFTVDEKGATRMTAETVGIYLDEAMNPKGEPLKRTYEIDLK